MHKLLKTLLRQAHNILPYYPSGRRCKEMQLLGILGFLEVVKIVVWSYTLITKRL